LTDLNELTATLLTKWSEAAKEAEAKRVSEMQKRIEIERIAQSVLEKWVASDDGAEKIAQALIAFNSRKAAEEERQREAAALAAQEQEARDAADAKWELARLKARKVRLIFVNNVSLPRRNPTLNKTINSDFKLPHHSSQAFLTKKEAIQQLKTLAAFFGVEHVTQVKIQREPRPDTENPKYLRGHFTVTGVI
jgi:hypothetical protein